MAPRDRTRPAPPSSPAPFPAAVPLLGGLLSGGLYALALPKAEFSALAWLALLPLLLPLLHPRGAALPPRIVLLAGLLAGLVAGAGRVYWIAETLGRYGGLGPLAAVSTTCLLALYLAIYPAGFAWACHRWRGARAALPWLAAALWTSLDWVQTWMISGFPWATLGTTQAGVPVVAQLASLTGVHGLTFVLVLAGAGLAVALTPGPGRWSAGLAVVVVPAAVGVHGLLRLQSLAHETSTAPPLRIGIVQGNIPQDVKWSPGWKISTTDRYLALTRKLAEAEAHDLIVWPETALPFRLDNTAHLPHWRAVTALARRLSTPLLVGSLGTRSPTGVPGLYNRSFVFDAEGALVGSADKVHLVPFGEYLPFPWAFRYLEGLTAQSGAFDPGEAHAVLALPGAKSTAAAPRFGVFICYESIFPGITRRLARDGAGFLINTTNDAWFGTTAAPYQHLSMVILRAIETGRTVVRAANTGISGAIGPDGTVHGATELFTTRALTTLVHPRSEVTPYVRWGDVIVVLSVLGLAVGAARQVRRRRSQVLWEMDRARAELDACAADPRPLRRPVVLLPGYASTPVALAALYAELQRAFTDAEARCVPVDLRQDASLAELVERASGAAPTEPCDWIGHSLGGIVAAGAALSRADDGARVFALAAPFGGSRWAALGRRLHLALPRTLADLGPGSTALRNLRRRLPELPGLVSLRLAGDPVGTGLDGSAVPETSYAMPFFVGPLRRHRAVHADPRVLRDLVHALRNPAPGD